MMSFGRDMMLPPSCFTVRMLFFNILTLFWTYTMLIFKDEEFKFVFVTAGRTRQWFRRLLVWFNVFITPLRLLFILFTVNMNTALHVSSTGLGLFQLSNIQLITTNMKELLKLYTVEGKGTSYTQASPQAIHKLHTRLCSSLLCIHIFS